MVRGPTGMEPPRPDKSSKPYTVLARRVGYLLLATKPRRFLFSEYSLEAPAMAHNQWRDAHRNKIREAHLFNHISKLQEADLA